MERFRVVAKQYNLSDVVDAHDQVLGLLAAYRTFLRDEVFFDFVSNVERPEQKTFMQIVSDSTANALAGIEAGGTVGALSGTVSIPIR